MTTQLQRSRPMQVVSFRWAFGALLQGRRMAETAANLVEHVLPERAPLRQFVLTLPFELRARLACDGKLLGAMCHAFVDSVLGWYRRYFEARDLGGGSLGLSPLA